MLEMQAQPLHLQPLHRVSHGYSALWSAKKCKGDAVVSLQAVQLLYVLGKLDGHTVTCGGPRAQRYLWELCHIPVSLHIRNRNFFTSRSKLLSLFSSGMLYFNSYSNTILPFLFLFIYRSYYF